MSRFSFLLAVVLAMGTACGGGGGGGGGGDTTDLTGWWDTQARLAGSGQLHQSVALAQLDQMGNAVWMQGANLTLTGSSLQGADPNYTAADRVEMDMQVVSPDQIEGIWVGHSTLGTFTLDVRMTRAAPEDGNFTATGNVLGQAVNLNSNVAWARTEEWPSSVDLDVMHADAHAPLSLFMDFEGTPPLGPGVYGVGPGANQVEVEIDRGAIGEEDATGGVVVINTLTLSRVEGTYHLDLPLGRSLQGDFTVDIIIRK